MREVTPDELKIRRFLLGDLEEAERERFEELFLTDPDFNEKVLIAERELIDDYLEGELDQTESERFREVFGTAPAQLRKLRIAESVRNYAKSEYAGSSEKPKRPYAYLAIAAAVLLILFGSIWLMRRSQFEQYAARQRTIRAEIERQLMAATAAATGSVESPQAKVTPLVLASVSTRGSGPESTVSLGSGAEAFDLWLLPTPTQYDVYNATLKRVGSQDQYNIPGLRLQTGTQGKLVRLRLPAGLFGPGIYDVELNAVGPNGQPVDAGRFTFQITN